MRDRSLSLLSALRSWLQTNRRAPRKLPSRRLGDGLVERLEDRNLLAVTFHGGQLLANVEAQAVYLGADWTTNSTLTAQSANLDQFLGSLVQSSYMDALSQAGYRVGRGSATAGAKVDGGINKGAGLTDAQIRSDLQSAIQSGQVGAPDANRLYVVYVEPGVVIKDGQATSQTSFLGYHGAFAGHDANGKSADIHYAVIAYPGTPNPSAGSQGFGSAIDQLTSVSSHELAEAVTDPNVNYKSLGWYDDQLNGEIGDLTRQTVRLNGFLVQKAVGQNDQPIDPTLSPPPTGSLTAPQNLAATALSPTSAKLTWTASPGAAGYRVYLANGTQSTLLGSLGAGATSATVTGLTSGTTVSFKVEAFSGTTVADSSVASVILPAQPTLTAPHVTAKALSPTSAQLSWGSVAGAQSYNVYLWNGTHAVLLGQLSGTRTSTTITGLSPGSTTSFIVEAVNGSAVADSAIASVTTPAQQQLVAPQVTITALSSSTVELSWGSVPGAWGYNIYWWNGTRAVFLGTVSAASTSVRVTGLPAGRLNQFVVEAFNGSEAAASDWVGVVTKAKSQISQHMS
jgi:hypothetical protein